MNIKIEELLSVFFCFVVVFVFFFVFFFLLIISEGARHESE